METKQSNNSVATTDAVKIASQRALFNLEWENDTVFKKRELNYKTKAAFQKDLEAGKISKYTTVFIKDSKEIYKNGQYYGNSEGGGVSGNFAECLLVNSEISTEIFSNLKPPFGKQTTFTPSEGLKNLLINNASKNISLIVFDYGGENISFGANITGDSQTAVILTMNIHTFPALLGFGTGFSLITIQLDVESNSVTITALPVPSLSSEATGNSFFCDDGQFKKIDSLTGFDEISLSQDIINGSTNSGNFTEEEYNKILAASEKGFIIVNLNGVKFLSKVSKDTLLEGKIQLNLFIGEVLKYEGAVLLANNITIKDKSENYAFTSDKYITNIYNGLQDGHIKINTNPGTDESTEIDLIVNGDGTKFLADDGRYKESAKIYTTTLNLIEPYADFGLNEEEVAEVRNIISKAQAGYIIRMNQELDGVYNTSDVSVCWTDDFSRITFSFLTTGNFLDDVGENTIFTKILTTDLTEQPTPYLKVRYVSVNGFNFSRAIGFNWEKLERYGVALFDLTMKDSSSSSISIVPRLMSITLDGRVIQNNNMDPENYFREALFKYSRRDNRYGKFMYGTFEVDTRVYSGTGTFEYDIEKKALYLNGIGINVED